MRRFLDESVYPGMPRNWDDVRLVSLIHESISPGARVLDFGAGRGKDPQFDFRGSGNHVVGVDVDMGVLQNELVDERHVIPPGGELPFSDDEFDLIYSANVLEHVANPASVFRELSRVLKPGGRFIGKTTNANHYIAIAARMTPFRFHRWYNNMRGRALEDTFVTVYACNSERQVRASIAHTDLQVVRFHFWEGRPEYLRFSTVSYLFGIAYEKLVNATEALRGYRAVMVVELDNVGLSSPRAASRIRSIRDATN